MDLSSYYNCIIEESPLLKLDEKESVLQLKDASFKHETNTFDTEIAAFSLENININICTVCICINTNIWKEINSCLFQGDLVCIEGPVGGGKSTFISALIAGVECINGQVCVQDFSNGWFLFCIFIDFKMC